MNEPNKTNNVLWQDELRKLAGDQVLHALEEITAGQHRTCERLNLLENKIDTVLKEHINTAFPGGDSDGHRRAHDTMINMMEERRRMYASIREKTLSGLIWGGLAWLGWAVLTKIRMELGLPP